MRVKQGFVVFLLCIVVLSVVGIRSEKFSLATSDVDTFELEVGDILFVDIYEGWCHGGFWDHLVLYVGQQDYGGEVVVEATFNGGICITALSQFYQRDEPAKISVRRLKDRPGREEIIQKAIEYSLDQIGKPFDFTATATLPAKINEKNLHCTELIWRAYKSAGIDLDGNGGLFIYPDDIYFSSNLEPV